MNVFLVARTIAFAFITTIGCSKRYSQQPNIVIALVDDLGWSDVGYNNISGIKTPHIDQLANQGIILSNHYVQPLCSPSRASLLTGKYPIHNGAGLNENVFAADEEAGLPLTETLLPEKLKQLGYDTALFGKWHLGLASAAYLPTRRGFDKFYGFYTGAIDYYRHNQTAHRCKSAGEHASYLDLRDQEKLVREDQGIYSSKLFNEQAFKLIDGRNDTKPLFLLMSYQNVHEPLQVPEYYSNIYSHFEDKSRQAYAGMTSYLDDSIRNLTTRLKHNGLWNNTLLIFMSDNGGSPAKSGFNWPLRGMKGTVWEGGIRSASFLAGGFLKQFGFTSKALVHISDWLPTILSLAGGHGTVKENNVSDNNNNANNDDISLAQKIPKEHEKIDGVNVWNAIASKDVESPRQYILHNINNRSYAIRKGQWKLVTEIDIGWSKPPESEKNSTEDNDNGHINAKTFRGYLLDPDLPRIRNGLFNVQVDSSERNDLSIQRPDVVKELLEIIDRYEKTKVPSHRVYRCNLKALERAKAVGAWGPFVN
eukprot:gene19907-21852_t